MPLPLPRIFAIVSALCLMACSTTVNTGGAAEASKIGFDAQKSAVPTATAEDYGLQGTLSEADLVALTALAWPQSYTSLSGRFGFPAKRSDMADYYQTPGGQWVAIFYSGGVATGYSVSDSQ